MKLKEKNSILDRELNPGLWLYVLVRYHYAIQDHACRNIKGAMKRKEMNEVSMEKLWNEICDKEKGRNYEENLPRPRFVHHETYME